MAYPNGSTITCPDGRKLRTGSARRYIIVKVPNSAPGVEQNRPADGTGKPYIYKRSDSLATALHFRNRAGNLYGSAFLWDQKLGQIVPSEGVTRCACGAKYWDFNQVKEWWECASCSTKFDGKDYTDVA
jgi:hypothetical protein